MQKVHAIRLHKGIRGSVMQIKYFSWLLLTAVGNLLVNSITLGVVCVTANKGKETSTQNSDILIIRFNLPIHLIIRIYFELFY
jgi:hypothetical protein